MKRAKVAIVVALAVALGAAACSSPSKNAGTSGNNNGGGKIATAHNVLDPNAKGPAAPVPGAKTGGTITIDSQSTPNALDPANMYYTDTLAIGTLIYRTPTELGEENGSPTLVPDLTDLGKESADGLSWTFTLKPGLKYSDGTPIQPADFAYAVERSLDTKLFSLGAPYNHQYFVDGSTYPGPYGGAKCGCVDSNSTSFTIHLTKKFNDLPFYMSFPAFAPIPAAKDTKANYELNPVATGPYMYDGPYVPGVSLNLKKNPYWDANSDPVRHQYANEWNFKWGGDDLKLQTAIITGSTPTDTTTLNYGNLNAALIPKVQPGGPNANQLVTGAQPCTYILNINDRTVPLAVRKALALAFPYDQVNKAAGNSTYTGIPASTILPPSVPGYTHYTPYPGLTGQGPGDPAAAKAALAAAGKTGFQLSWYYDNTTPTTQHVEEAMANGLTAAGFKVKPIGVTPQQIRTKTSDYSAPVNIGQSPAGWCSDWPSGTTWFGDIFTKAGYDGSFSFGQDYNDALTAQITAIENLPPSQAAAKWGALDKQLLGQYPVLPLYYTKAANIYGTALGGVTINPAYGMPAFQNMFVKQP